MGSEMCIRDSIRRAFCPIFCVFATRAMPADSTQHRRTTGGRSWCWWCAGVACSLHAAASGATAACGKLPTTLRCLCAHSMPSAAARSISPSATLCLARSLRVAAAGLPHSAQWPRALQGTRRHGAAPAAALSDMGCPACPAAFLHPESPCWFDLPQMLAACPGQARQ